MSLWSLSTHRTRDGRACRLRAQARRGRHAWMDSLGRDGPGNGAVGNRARGTRARSWWLAVTTSLAAAVAAPVSPEVAVAGQPPDPARVVSPAVNRLLADPAR